MNYFPRSSVTRATLTVGRAVTGLERLGDLLDLPTDQLRLVLQDMQRELDARSITTLKISTTIPISGT